MKKIIALVLIICLALVLFNFIFNDGKDIDFEQSYKDLLNFTTDVGEAFGFAGDFVEKITDFFERLNNFITS